MSNRLLELDIFRGIAAFSVMLFHYTCLYDEYYGHADNLLFKFSVGSNGVRLFFMISGFVIFMTLKKTEKPMDFIVSRISRLYPAYWMAIVLTFSVVLIFSLPERQTSLECALLNLSMFQWLFKAPNVDGAYWTLAIELSFYIIMLLLFMSNLLNRIEDIGILWIIMQLLCWFLENSFGFKISDIIKTAFILKYANLFIAGIMFYRIMNEGNSAYSHVVILFSLLTQWIISDKEIAFIVSCLFCLFYLFVFGKLSFIIYKPLVFLGIISYPLYLIHQNIGYVIILRLYKYHVNPMICITAATITVVFLASLITFFVEKPALKAIRNDYKRNGYSLMTTLFLQRMLYKFFKTV